MANHSSVSASYIVEGYIHAGVVVPAFPISLVLRITLCAPALVTLLNQSNFYFLLGSITSGESFYRCRNKMELRRNGSN